MNGCTNQYFGITDPQFAHATKPRIGVIITNLGTPDDPSYWPLRRYLKQFLADPRVIEYNRLIWWFIRQIVLIFRPGKSAANYRKIWTERGSPLLFISQDQKAGLAKALQERFGDQVIVDMAMRYGNPSIESVVMSLLSKNVDRLLVIPLYPQYAGPTTGTTFDEVARVLSKVRYVPEVRFVNKYHDETGYIAAIVNSVREAFASGGQPDKLVFSYHGVPKRYLLNGDPYFCHCHKTSRLVAEALGLPKEKYLVCFQSLFGREEWLRPYLIQTVAKLAKSGVKKMDIVCPGFSADCLETIEEIDVENRECFIANGGEKFRYIPALNARPDFITFLADLVAREIATWVNHPRVNEPAGEHRVKLAEAEGS